MRVAALYDIHGNLPALEAVLKEVRAFDVDLIVVGGDVLPGPMAHQCVTLLQELDVPTAFLRGNGDRVVVEVAAGSPAGGFPEEWHESIAWNSQQLSEEQLAFVSSWPATRRMRIVGLGEVLFCHATPKSDSDTFTKHTPEEQIRPAFEKLGDVSLVVCGHTHMTFDRKIGDVRVVNAGSIGAPFGEGGAHWLMLGPGVQFRHTHYDLASAAQLVRYSGYPRAEDFAMNSILFPPSEEKMLALFNGAPKAT